MSIYQALRRMFRQKNIATAPAATVTLWDVLRTYVSDAELDRIHSATPDRRMMVGAVARFIDVDEGGILRKWCAHRGFEYLERIPPADFTVVKSPLSSTLLRDYGATVVTESDRVVGIACVDPDRIDEIRASLIDIPVVVARWDEVRRHLDESCRAAEELTAVRIREATERLRETTEMVLRLVVHDVVDRGLSAVTIDLSVEDSRYTIFDGQGRQFSGSLHPMLQPVLKEILAADCIDVLMPSGSRQPVDIAREPGRERFHLSWGDVPVPYPHDRPAIGQRGDEPNGGETCQSPSQRSKGVIFVIDDNPGFREIVCRFLERHGFDVRTLQSAMEAWSALEDGAELDLIVCDVHMPGMDGYDFVRRLRANTAGRRVPIIALTSDDGVETEIRLVRAGVSAFVSKSADPRVLCAHVERWCEESRR